MIYDLSGNSYVDTAIENELNQYELLGYDIDSMIESELDNAEMMGYDSEEPELMGGIIKRIIARIRARRAERKAAMSAPPPVAAPQYALTTPVGNVAYNQAAGLQFTDPARQGVPITQSNSFMDKVKANPMPYAAVGAAVLFVMMKRK